MKTNLFRHITAFLLSVLLAVVFLLAGACLPQGPVDENIRSSAEGMLPEGIYPTMADHSYASILDYGTDSLILTESKAMNIRQWETIFTNPLFQYEIGEHTPVENLYQYANDPDPEPTSYYVQYWMGFRPVIRLLLCFFDYFQILRYTAICFFILLALVLCDVAKRAGTKTAFLFALSIILVRPHVISVSLQFSCCFFITFLAMLLIPRLQNAPQWETLFFLELGILTMYFDFYTTPVLTFVMPMTYLYLLECRKDTICGIRRIGRNAACWGLGYVGMWLMKLILTSALTEADGLGTGILSFFGRIGVEKVSGMEQYYDPMVALRTVALSLYSDQEGKWVLFGALALVFVWLVFRFLQDRHSVRDLLKNKELLILAALPILWFMVAAQPTANHHWFQYRGIAGTFWAGFVYLLYLLQRRQDTLAPETAS